MASNMMKMIVMIITVFCSSKLMIQGLTRKLAHLVVVYPPDPVVLGDGPHGLGQGLRLGHHEVVVDDGDDVALGAEGAGHLLVDPVLLLLVPDAPVQGTWC